MKAVKSVLPINDTQSMITIKIYTQTPIYFTRYFFNLTFNEIKNVEGRYSKFLQTIFLKNGLL